MSLVLAIALVIGAIYICESRGLFYSPVADEDEQTVATVTKVLEAFDELAQAGELISHPGLVHERSQRGQTLRRKYCHADLTMPQEEQGSLVNVFKRFTGTYVCSGTLWFYILDSGEVKALPREMTAPVFSGGVPSSTRIQVGRSLAERVREEVDDGNLRLSKIRETVLVRYWARVEDDSRAIWSVDAEVVDGLAAELSRLMPSRASAGS